MNHKEKCEAALKALNEICSDMSVSRDETRRSLRDLRDEIDIMLEAIDN